MAITYFVQTAGSYVAYGLSTDTKPTSPPNNCLFIEIDTSNSYTSSASAWVLTTKHKIVKALTDFPTPVANVITLEDYTTYIINGTVSIGANRITVGIQNSIIGIDRFNDKLVYTDTSNFITIGASNVFTLFENLSFTCATGTLLSVTTGSFRFNECSISGVSTLGTITTGASSTFRNCGITSGTTQGFIFVGACGSLKVLGCSISNNVGNLFDLGTATFSIVDCSNNYITCNASQIFLKGTTSGANITQGGKGNNNFFTGAGSFLNTIAIGDANWKFTDNIPTTLNDLVTASVAISQTTIDFGTTPINEKTFTITDVSCTATSKLILFIGGVAQTNENYGIQLNLSYIPAVGSFQITADAGKELVRGQFIINYLIA